MTDSVKKRTASVFDGQSSSKRARRDDQPQRNARSQGTGGPSPPSVKPLSDSSKGQKRKGPQWSARRSPTEISSRAKLRVDSLGVSLGGNAAVVRRAVELFEGHFKFMVSQKSPPEPQQVNETICASLFLALSELSETPSSLRTVATRVAVSLKSADKQLEQLETIRYGPTCARVSHTARALSLPANVARHARHLVFCLKNKNVDILGGEHGEIGDARKNLVTAAVLFYSAKLALRQSPKLAEVCEMLGVRASTVEAAIARLRSFCAEINGRRAGIDRVDVWPQRAPTLPPSRVTSVSRAIPQPTNPSIGVHAQPILEPRSDQEVRNEAPRGQSVRRNEASLVTMYTFEQRQALDARTRAEIAEKRREAGREALLARFCTALDLPDDVKCASYGLATRVEKSVLQGKVWAVVAATSVYVMSRIGEREDERSLREVAAASSVPLQRILEASEAVFDDLGGCRCAH